MLLLNTPAEPSKRRKGVYLGIGSLVLQLGHRLHSVVRVVDNLCEQQREQAEANFALATAQRSVQDVRLRLG